MYIADRSVDLAGIPGRGGGGERGGKEKEKQ